MTCACENYVLTMNVVKVSLKFHDLRPFNSSDLQPPTFTMVPGVLRCERSQKRIICLHSSKPNLSFATAFKTSSVCSGVSNVDPHEFHFNSKPISFMTSNNI